MAFFDRDKRGTNSRFLRLKSTDFSRFRTWCTTSESVCSYSMKVSELAGSQLDFWVAKAEGVEASVDTQLKFTPSTDWAQGGPIIDREGIQIAPMPAKGGTWCAVSIGRLPNRAGSSNGAWVEGPAAPCARRHASRRHPSD